MAPVGLPSFPEQQSPDSTAGRSAGSSGSDYSHVRSVGSGSFGEATLAKDREGHFCVMKSIDITKLDKVQQADAANEVKVLSSLKHPYIVRYHESFVEKGTLIIVMDYAEGGDLSKLIANHRRKQQLFTEPQILRWFTQIALGLKYLHKKHIIHRDLKPQNIFLTKDNDLRLGDFGISTVLGRGPVKEHCTIGTPYYMSPEICQDKLYSYASDMWAFGCILFEMAALRVPFEAANIPALIWKITNSRLPALPTNFSQELRDLCQKLLSREAGQRPSASQVVRSQLLQAEIRRMLPDPPDQGAAPPANEPTLLNHVRSQKSMADDLDVKLRSPFLLAPQVADEKQNDRPPSRLKNPLPLQDDRLMGLDARRENPLMNERPPSRLKTPMLLQDLDARWENQLLNDRPPSRLKTPMPLQGDRPIAPDSKWEDLFINDRPPSRLKTPLPLQDDRLIAPDSRWENPLMNERPQSRLKTPMPSQDEMPIAPDSRWENPFMKGGDKQSEWDVRLKKPFLNADFERAAAPLVKRMRQSPSAPVLNTPGAAARKTLRPSPSAPDVATGAGAVKTAWDDSKDGALGGDRLPGNLCQAGRASTLARGLACARGQGRQTRRRPTVAALQGIH